MNHKQMCEVCEQTLLHSNDKNQEEFCDQIINLLQQLKEGVEHHMHQILEIIDKLLTNLSIYITIIKGQRETGKYNLENIMVEAGNKLYEEMSIFSKVSNIDKLINITGSLNKKLVKQQLQFDYHLLEKTSKIDNQRGFALAFNNDASILVEGSHNLINVFQFKQDKLKKIQQLNGHASQVVFLQFLKKLNQLISGSWNDGCIIIWEQSRKSKWKSKQVLQAHTGPIFTIVINQNEDMLISGSADKTIKFYQKKNEVWNFKQIFECSNFVLSVSLSNNENKLIASINDNQILVMELQESEWIITQKILLEQIGNRLLFINQNQFVFQPKIGQNLLIYNFDQREQKFEKGQEVFYSKTESDEYCLFPIFYNQHMGMILVKHGEYVHVIQTIRDGQFFIQQSIHFSTNDLFGCISDDGKYLATWDGKSKQIQIRKQSEK